jgi:tetratricopeptide (TPR) repeat protein
MNKGRFVMTAALALFVVSCAGGKAVEPVPRHLKEGGRQMQTGLEWYYKGCYRQSLVSFLRAYEIYSASDNLDSVAMSLNNIGTIHRTMGNYEVAVSFFQEAYTTYLDLNDPKGALQALSNMAGAFIHMGELDTAEEVIEQALSLASKNKGRRLFVPLMQNKGVLLTKKGLHQEAEKALTACLNQAGDLNPQALASLHFAFGTLMLETDRPADAVTSFERALAIDREIGFYRGIADDLFSMGQAYMKLGQSQKAVRSWKRCVKIFALIDQAREVQDTMKHLKKAAQEADMDISVTEAFVRRWRQGRLYESPCVE